LDLATAAIICSPPHLTTRTLADNTAIADTGASDHYFTPTAPVINVTTGNKPAILRTATGELKHSSASAHLAIQGIPTDAATWNWGKIDDGKINDDLFVENARTQTIDFIISFTNFLLQNKRCKRERAVTPNWDTQSHRPLYHSLN